MKIGLISPKANYLSRNPRFEKFWQSSPVTRSYRHNWSGLGPALPVLAALSPDNDIEIIDENLIPIDFSKGYDLVGITAMTHQATRAYLIADEFRKRGSKVAIGGYHATLLPEDVQQHTDTVVVGEAENIWASVVSDMKQGRLKPQYHNKEAIDLKYSPIPRYDLIDGKSYKIIWLQTSRGCPHDCDFCASSKIYGKKYRRKSHEQVIQEVKLVQSLFGPTTTIGFGDDNFFVDRKQVKELLPQLAELKIRWLTQTDISIADDPELLLAMRNSGCQFVFIGFESVSEEALRNIDSTGWKVRRLQGYRESVDRIQSMGIGIVGSFIIGLDTDGEDSFKRVADFIVENNLYDGQIAVSTPLPGTRLRERLLKEGRVLSNNWEDYSVFDVTFRHPKLSREQIEDGLLFIYQTINSPEVYLKKMRYFTNKQKSLIAHSK